MIVLAVSYAELFLLTAAITIYYCCASKSLKKHHHTDFRKKRWRLSAWFSMAVMWKLSYVFWGVCLSISIASGEWFMGGNK
jgi:hypothetical protein